jgi:hypothetical protein
MREARRAIVVALHRIIEHSLHVRSSWCRLRSNMARADPLSSSMLTHGVVVGRDVWSLINECLWPVVAARTPSLWYDATEHQGDHTMALTGLQRALLEAESELGEQAILKESNGTFTVNNTRSGANVLAAGTAASVPKTRVTPIRPAIGKITT